MFLSIAIAAGLTCPTVDAAKVRPTVLTADLALERGKYAMRSIKDFRKRQSH